MPTVYWYCPKPDAPSGGVWFIHRLAQMLSNAGIASRVCRWHENFDVWWDAHPIDEMRIPLVVWPEKNGQPGREGDTVVIPEVMWDIVPPQPGLRRILFLQNYIWLGQEVRDRIRAEKPEILVPSRYLFNWCTRELGVRPLPIIPPFLDDDVWRPTPKTANLVVLYARRNPTMAEELREAIQVAGFPVELIFGEYSQRDLTSWLDRAEFYVHHVEPEGFPMAALEAMRSGVIPVGTTGGGGNEFMFNDETALVCAGPMIGRYSDPQIFVDKVVGLLQRLRADSDLRSRLWTQGYNWSLRYNAAATIEQLLKVFNA